MEGVGNIGGLILLFAIGIITYKILFNSPSSNTPKRNHWNSITLTEEEKTPEALYNEIQEKISKDVSNLPVHVDLPRLARKMEIIINGKVKIKAEEGELELEPNFQKFR